MSSTLIFIFVLSVLIVVHEFGHFMVAKWVGIRVERFSIGFGPVILRKAVAGTEFCVSLLPLGGYVKMAGESPEEAKGNPWEFNSKSLGQKFLVVVAGPLMNAVLAFVIFSGIFLVGQPTLTSAVGRVLEGTPAQAAGLEPGDRIVAVNGEPAALWEDVLRQIRESEGALVFSVRRDDRLLEMTVLPEVRESKDLFGKTHRLSFVGVAPSNEMVYIRSGFFQAVAQGAERVWKLTSLIFYSFGMMITGGLSFKESVTGPIGIFFMTQQAAQLGVAYLLYFMGALSVSLFVLNLLPIPVLDGGHLLFILIEKIKGSPLRDSVKERMTQGGLVLLLALMVYVVFQDAQRFSIFENIKNFFIRS